MKNKVEAIKAVLGDGEDILDDVQITTSALEYSSDIPVLHQNVKITFTYLCRDNKGKVEWGAGGFLDKVERR